MIDYWMMPDGRSGLVPVSGTLALPKAGTRHTASAPHDLPKDARLEYDMVRDVVAPPRAEIIAAANAMIATAHAAYLNAATGGATIEERDTWAPKADAARAYIAGTATDAQTMMIEGEAAGDDTDPMALAQGVVDKADGFMRLIGRAGNIRSKAQAALAAIPGKATASEAQAAVQAALAEMHAAMQAG